MTADAARASDAPRLPLVLTLVGAQLLVILDSSVLNVALPSIARELGLSATGTAWILGAYYLSFGGLLLVSGRAADVFGRRRMVLVGASVLMAGSFVGAFAPNGEVLVAARLIQGAGAAMLSPAAMSTILARITGQARARAMGWWGAASTAGGALGVGVGGLLTGAFGWQSVMFVTAGVALVLLVASWFLLPADERTERRPFDGTGAALITAAAVGIVYAVLAVPNTGLSVDVLVAVLVVVAAVVGFALAERRAPDPLLPLSALRDPRVSGGSIVNLLGGAARIACFALVALLLQQVLRFEPGVAGAAMLPTSLAGFVISSTLLPRVLRRFGPERVAFSGLVMLIAAHALFALVTPDTNYVIQVLPVLFLAATGVAFSFTPTTLVIADGVAARNVGVSSGLASATAQIGGAIGLAVFGALDAAARARVAEGGGSLLEAAHAGLSVAHSGAAVAAAVAAALAFVAFPGLRRRREAAVASRD